MVGKKTEENKKYEYEVEVLRAYEMEGKSNTTYAVDLKVNGITIYGCFYKEGTKNGKEWSLVQFPQYKGQDSKGETAYYNHVWFPTSREFTQKVAEGITSLNK